MHYFQFEIKEWVSNTAHLSLEEEAIYLRLINYYYDSEKPLPLDAKEMGLILRKLRIADKKEIVGQIIEEFFTTSDQGFIHDRCELEIARFKDKSDKARTSAEKRWKSESNANAQRPHSESNANHKSLIINQESLINNQIKTNPIAPKVAIPIGVDENLWKDFLTLRRSKKLPVTTTALKGIEREARKANKSLSEVLTICCERGWGGFKADWLVQEALRTKDKPTERWDSSLAGVMNKGKELGILPRPGESELDYRTRLKSAI